jgi:Winged helix DNA-binding domain
MNDLNKALGDISSIRRQMAQSTEFGGYGPRTLASMGVLAIAGAGAQALWLPDPANHVAGYLSIWIGTAAMSAALIGAQMYTGTRRIHSGMADEMIRMAVEQFLPSVGAGAQMILVLVRDVPASLFLLPGIWQVIFSLGVFSSCRFLPRPVSAVGAKGLAFGDLKPLCALTDGNLSRHLCVLEKGKMVGMVKEYHRNRPQTVCHITASGRQRYVEYLSTLERAVRDAAKITKEGPATGLIRGLAPSRA